MSRTVWIINQYASTPATGMGGRHFYLAKELAKQGHRVYVIAAANHHLLRDPPKISGAYKFEKTDGFTFVWVKLPPYRDAHSNRRVLNWFLFPWRIQSLIGHISDKPDAVLCSSPSLISFLGAKRLARRFQARLVFEVRDIWPLTLTEIGGYSRKHPFIRFLQWVEDMAYRDSDRVVSNLKFAVEHMVNRGMRRPKFKWIPNGISVDEVRVSTTLNDNVAAIIPKGKFIVGYTGTLGFSNALDTLIEAANILRDYSDIAFVIVGDGKERRALESLVKEKSLQNVFFAGPIPKAEIQAILKRFDACYIGLTNNSLFRFGVSPNKLFDYLYSRRPVIYAIDSAAYKPVSEIGAGIQIPPGSPEKLAAAVLELTELPAAERSAMGERGRNAVLEHYEYQGLAQKLAAVLFC